jgi:hypothetical protein
MNGTRLPISEALQPLEKVFGQLINVYRNFFFKKYCFLLRLSTGNRIFIVIFFRFPTRPSIHKKCEQIFRENKRVYPSMALI